MTSVLLQPKRWGMDAASFRRFTDFGRVKEAGGEWVSLYVDGDHGVDRAVIEAAWATGLLVMLNFELYDQAAKYGYSQGVAHAQRAMAAVAPLGFRGEAPLIFSGADFNPTAAQMPAVLDYHRALVDTYTLGVGGAYGPRSVLEPLSRQPWWPADWPLWHWGGDGATQYPWAWVKQGPGGSYFNAAVGFNVDNNLLLKPMRFWSGYGEDRFEPDVIPVPAWKDPDMPALFKSDDAIHWPGSPTLAEGDYPPNNGHIFLIVGGDAGGQVRHVPGPESQLYLKAGATVVTLPGTAGPGEASLAALIADGGVYSTPAAVTGAPTRFTGTVELTAS